MELSGKKIAEQIYTDLIKQIGRLRRKNVTPHLVVLLVGEKPASIAHVNLKQKKADYIGAKVTILRFEETITTEELIKKLDLLNTDPFVHGILIQRPLPKHIDEKKLALATNPQKDVDGFHPDSPFVLPLAPAVVRILEEIYKKIPRPAGHPLYVKGVGGISHNDNFLNWLKSQKIVIIGKGPSGGGPIIAYLKGLGLTPHIIDSKTKNPETITKHATIIVTAVGKYRIITGRNITKGVVHIGVGVGKDPIGRLCGDYEEEEIKDIAAFYTPTPGGTGPVNVAMLMKNLVTAAERQIYL